MSGRHDLRADPAQMSAIRQGGGPCAVIAGPGSGKTFVLTQRIRYLIDTVGVDPFSILVLTFSRAAAAQMRSRFFSLCGQADVVFGTFHSVFYRILQESVPEKLSVIRPAAKEKYLRHLCSSGLLPRGTTPEALQLCISRFKNGLICREPWVPGLVREYDLYLQNRGWLDFDDMILRCRRALEKDPAALAKWRARFSWILVDEFQDVSPSQYEILRLLAAPKNNLFIVGDDDQSIYGFRGADPGTMQRFLREYSLHRDSGKVIFLGTNYRCGRAILQAGSALIRCNENRIPKAFRAGTGDKGRFHCRPFTDPAAEYAFLADRLGEMTAGERAQTAVIFRTHWGAQAFLQVLTENRIPFQADGTCRRKNAAESARTEILRDLAAYYRSACALAGDGALGRDGALRGDLLRIMNRPERYLSGSFVTGEKMNRDQLLENAGISREAVEELLVDLARLESLRPALSMRYLLDSVGYRACLASAAAAQDASAADLGAFVDSLKAEAASYPDAPGWLARLEDLLDLSASAPVRAEGQVRGGGDGENDGSGTGCVQILTMHACKGLEFDTVFLPDLNEGNLPSRRAWTRDQVEEERRLFYVAMTRARHDLTLLYLEGTPDRPAEPSRFLEPFRSLRAVFDAW